MSSQETIGPAREKEKMVLSTNETGYVACNGQEHFFVSRSGIRKRIGWCDCEGE